MSVLESNWQRRYGLENYELGLAIPDQRLSNSSVSFVAATYHIADKQMHSRALLLHTAGGHRRSASCLSELISLTECQRFRERKAQIRPCCLPGKLISSRENKNKTRANAAKTDSILELQ